MKDKLDQYIDGVKDLPPSPSVMIELIKLLEKPDRDLDQLVDLMSNDLSLTAEVLRRCNSAFFGVDRPASDIFEATFRMGFYEVYRVATALFAAQAMGCAGVSDGLQIETVWEHSALAAVSAAVLAREIEESEGLAFTAGLLHDIGKVVLACAEGKRYAQLVDHSHVQAPLSPSERKLFGFDHCEIGGRLLARWGFPIKIITPVQYHHSPVEAMGFGRLAAMVQLADCMAYGLATGRPNEASANPIGAFAIQVLQLKTESFPGLMARAQKDADRVKALFHMRN